jgi:alkaline phosphatase D
MKKRLCFSFLFVVLSPVFAGDSPISRIAFGSCARQYQPQPVWVGIRKIEPELFVFMGDNVYADVTYPVNYKAAYDALNANEAFQAVRGFCPIIGTWDDHDYGQNDAGANFPDKKRAQEAFFDFFNVPANSPRRIREGVYSAEIYGTPGRRVQVILLDTRTFRSPLKKDIRALLPPRRYLPNTSPGATLLGRRQWSWLRDQLLVPADIRLIVSSIQVLPAEQPREKWGNFPLERKYLFTLLKETKASGVLFLSGDRHFAEISREKSSTGTVYYEITSSSLNSSEPPEAGNRNSRRLGNPYLGNNFGFLSIDWDSVVPRISAEIRDEEGHIRLQQDILISELKTNE